MRNILLVGLLSLFLTGCATMQRAGLAAGGAAAGSFLGPAGAAVGAAGGVIASDVIDAQSDPVQVIAGQAGVPVTGPAPGTAASTIHESKNFIETIGYWYLLIFILVPFLTKNGRKWLGNFKGLANAASKKDVDSAATRLNKLEEMIASINPKEEK